MRSHPGLAALLALAACGDQGPPLHERDAFSGEVELRREGGSIRGSLLFRRDTGSLQLSLADGDGPVVLARNAEGHLRAFEEAVWRDPTPRESEWFGVVEEVVRQRGDAGYEVLEGGYAVQVGGRWIEVRIH